MREYKKLIQCIVLLLIFIIFTLLIKYYFKPFFAIVFLIILCNPVYKLLCKLKLFNDKINAIISIIFINIVVFIILLYMGNFIIREIGAVAIDYYNNLNGTGLNHVSLTKDFNLNNLIVNLKSHIVSFINSDFIKKGAIYTTDGIFSYFVGNMAVYFILVDKYDIVNLSKMLFTEEKVKLLIDKFEKVKQLLKVEVSLVLVTSLETVAGFYILGIKDAFMLGALCGILDILPYVGTIIVFIPLILCRINEQNYIIAFGLLFLYILLQINRQILETKFMSTKLKIHPLLILISIYVGVKLFGIIGLFMGPLYVISAKEIIFSF
ncbi:AI-2E family transporter [Clostridium hydrogenum]|uniref:AI-2E family transporter n=1 Tax=Clostridium hydrogenum TaxID=2855764 RepID=UPI002E2F4BB3|nr:AI-2E family transporter [Clostridium hydrogenum]